jgi:hypothetical protein
MDVYCNHPETLGLLCALHIKNLADASSPGIVRLYLLEVANIG